MKKQMTAIPNPTTPVTADPNAIKYTNAELIKMATDQAAQYKKNVIRASIQQKAGDPLSMLGTVSDAVQVLLVSYCELLESISKATTLAEVRAAAAGNSLATDGAAMLTDIKSGAVVMPYAKKGGVVAVMPDIKSRATAVSSVL